VTYLTNRILHHIDPWVLERKFCMHRASMDKLQIQDLMGGRGLLSTYAPNQKVLKCFRGKKIIM
jgi:hypothetical protein